MYSIEIMHWFTSISPEAFLLISTSLVYGMILIRSLRNRKGCALTDPVDMDPDRKFWYIFAVNKDRKDQQTKKYKEKN